MKTLRLFYYLILIIAAITLAFYYVAQEDNIYYWDYIGYWRAWQELSAQITAAPWHGLQLLQQSIHSSDYNTAPVFLLYPFSLIPLPSRSAYILSLVITYLLPVCLFVSCIARAFAANKTAIALFTFTFALTFTPFWAPVLRGYPDISGLIPILLVVIYSMKHDLSGKFHFRDALSIGFLLWLPFLLRRWYAYTIVILYGTLPVFNYYWHKNDNPGKHRLFTISKHIMVAGIISIAFACLFQGGLIHRIASTNYNDIYSAYYSPMSTNLAIFLNRIGYYFLPLPILGIMAIFTAKKRESRIFAAFCLANLCLAFILFSRTQAPDMHHTLPFALWTLFLAIIGIIHLLEIWPIRVFSRYALPFLLALNTIALCSALFIGQTLLFPRKNMPLQLTNIAEMQRLINTLDKLVGQEKTFAFLSSSYAMNYDMLRTFSGRKFGTRQLESLDVDLRDRFNAAILRADYLVVADPVQLHLKESGQRIVSIPVEALLQQQNIGKSFDRLPETFILDKDIKAYIYARNRPYQKAQLQDFFNKLYVHYPEWRQYYDTPLIYAYALADIQPGDVWGAFAAYNDGTIFAHPGENTPTRIHWVLENISHLYFTSINTNCNQADTIRITLSSATIAPQTYELSKGGTLRIDTQAFNGSPSTLEIARNQSSGCDAIIIGTDKPQP